MLVKVKMHAVTAPFRLDYADLLIDELVKLSNFHDPKRRVTESVRYEVGYRGRVELENSVSAQLVVEKRVKNKKAKHEKEEL
jgi:hypothetical protein